MDISSIFPTESAELVLICGGEEAGGGGGGKCKM